MIRKVLLLGGTVAALLGSGCTPQPTAPQAPATSISKADVIQFTTNFIWCWQMDYNVVGGMSHDYFNGRVLQAYREQNIDDDTRLGIRALYRTCENSNASALAQLNQTDDQLMRGTRHMISCYPSHAGAGKLPDGAPATPEGQSVGLKTCNPL